jgi:hypothetical protein
MGDAGCGRNRIGRFCYNSGYLEMMKQIVTEQLAYGIAGFHLDMLDQGFGPPYGCWCETCQQQFRQRFGHDMPPGVAWDEAWDHMLQFRYDTSDRFEKQLAAAYQVHQALKRLSTSTITAAHLFPLKWVSGLSSTQATVISSLAKRAFGGFSALGVGLNAEFYRAATPGLPVQVAIQRGVRMYHDQTTRPLHDMRWELFSLLAHGSFVTMVDKTAFDGWLDPVAYDRFGAAFSEVQSKREHFGQQPGL